MTNIDTTHSSLRKIDIKLDNIEAEVLKVKNESVPKKIWLQKKIKHCSNLSRITRMYTVDKILYIILSA